jgi:signal transduction histidine kinase
VFAISLLGALALSVYLSRRLSDPLREVERGAQLIGNGELSHRVVVDTGDEVEALAESFNQMARRLTEVRAQEQLALLGRMAAGVVHDIRNPLTSIKGFADLLVSTDDREERREFGAIVQEDTDRILSMVQELLDFSRGGTADLRLKTVSLRGFLERVADTLRRDLERVGVAVELGPIDDAPVNLDVSRMTRMVLNIASNARESMQREGGVFTIEAHRLDGTVRIALQDTGPGIPEEVAYTLFEPFVTSGKENGTGLGLAICKQIVEAHGGTISFDDSVPRGARFVVELPVATGEMPKAVE